MVVVRSFVHFFSFSFCCTVSFSLQMVGDDQSWGRFGNLLKRQYLFQGAPPWLVPDDDFWLSFAGKRGLSHMLLSVPFQWHSAASKILSFASIRAASNRERLGESRVLHPAWITSAKFILGAFFGANALNINTLRLSHHSIQDFNNCRSDFASINSSRFF